MWKRRSSSSESGARGGCRRRAPSTLTTTIFGLLLRAELPDRSGDVPAGAEHVLEVRRAVPRRAAPTQMKTASVSLYASPFVGGEPDASGGDVPPLSIRAPAQMGLSAPSISIRSSRSSTRRVAGLGEARR